jgi:hypothetical protein
MGMKAMFKFGVAASCCLFLAAPAMGQQGECLSDVNGDGVVDGSDLAVMASEFGTTQCGPAGGFEDNGDGTVTDHESGLMWEKKDSAGGVANLNNPHDVDNLYAWTSTGTAADGAAFTDFLQKLNNTCWDDGTRACVGDSDCAVSNGGPGGPCGFAGYQDWRLPQVNRDGGVAEYETILDCSFSPWCIDPIFGPRTASSYWSSITRADGPIAAWGVFFSNGNVAAVPKIFGNHVRAVRGGR